jgi:hypothetical protein
MNLGWTKRSNHFIFYVIVKQERVLKFADDIHVFVLIRCYIFLERFMSKSSTSISMALPKDRLNLVCLFCVVLRLLVNGLVGIKSGDVVDLQDILLKMRFC